MSVAERVYAQMPESMQPVVRKWYYRAHPGLSWRKWKKRDEATDEFVAQFFDEREEYERYREEFFEGRIRDICERAVQEVENGKAIYDAHQDECAKLYALVRKRRPETVVETGVYSGVSTVSTLLALDRNEIGTLHSLDAGAELLAGGGGSRTGLDGTGTEFYERGRPSCSEAGSHELPPDRDPGWIIPDDLRDPWELTIGRSRRDLPELLADVGEIDLFFHDSEYSTTGMLFEFELAWEWLRNGGVVLSPHVDRNDAFETFAAERDCVHGLSSYEYLGTSEYDEPCSCGYVVKESSPR